MFGRSLLKCFGVRELLASFLLENFEFWNFSCFAKFQSFIWVKYSKVLGSFSVLKQRYFENFKGL
jgi:hypothetical protein